jgi:hypothetical protein
MIGWLLVSGLVFGWIEPAPSAEEGANLRPRRPYLLVSPAGPQDGGDFGPNTPGTKTAGLQEAFDAAKALRRDLYIEGGSWTEGKNQPVVYGLDETLRIPWMQDFRLDGGHYVLNYNPKKGDAVVIDSQMSCSYRFGLVVSNSDGAVVRIGPSSAGPDRFRVVTSTEFVFNAIVGGGGAWPGGAPFQNQIDPEHAWVGVGLWLDGSTGSIDANKFTILETVGCRCGLLAQGAVTRNTIEETNIHLCQEHLVIGGPGDARVSDNRIEAFASSQGIAGSVGLRLFGRDNMVTLSSQQMGPGSDVIFEKEAAGNLVLAHRLDSGVTHRAQVPTNRVQGSVVLPVETPAVPLSGEKLIHRQVMPVAVRIVSSGQVRRVTEERGGKSIVVEGPLQTGLLTILAPGDSIELDYVEAPQWTWVPAP